jgi:exopolyphosphatase/pppGpp-phosphohydrolase
MWVHDMIVNASLEQRLNIPGLPAERAKLAPVGLTLMKSVIDLFAPTSILVSSYAMKEGILRDMTGEY